MEREAKIPSLDYKGHEPILLKIEYLRRKPTIVTANIQIFKL